MVEYIKREDALNAIRKSPISNMSTRLFCIDAIADIPASDVVERKQWIPVSERLPLLNTPVLATDGIEVDISWMYGVPPRWITNYTAIDEDKLTHWMPLPQTPKE